MFARVGHVKTFEYIALKGTILVQLDMYNLGKNTLTKFIIIANI